MMVTRPRIVGVAMDAIDQRLGYSRLLFWIGAYLAAAAVEGFFSYISRRKIINSSREVEYELRKDFFEHLQKLTASFYHRHMTGDLMARATNDIAAVRNMLGPAMLYSANNIVLLPLAMISMVQMDVGLSFLVLLPLLALGAATYLARRAIHDRFRRTQEAFSELSNKAQEDFAGIRVVKAYAREDNEIREFEELSWKNFELGLSMARLESLFYPMLALFGSSGIILLLWYGGHAAISGDITPGDFAAYLNYLGMLMWPMISLGFVLNRLQTGAASMVRILEIMDTDPEFHSSADGRTTSMTGQIEFKNLTFRYGPDLPAVLERVDLRIPAGSSLAIVGATGSGKSTLVNLLPRIYDPPPETLFIDGVDVRNISVEELRRRVACVPQDTFLFSKTIGDNIKYGRAEAEDNQMIHAAAVSRIHDTVMEFPERYKTMLGERGVNLSGGQKQRTTLSRAVLMEARILILDDALSSVDTQTEEEILEQLQEEMLDRTTIVISHRISTVKDCDNIIVLDEGRIAEEGNHEQLLALGGLYAQMHQDQLLREALEKEEVRSS